MFRASMRNVFAHKARLLMTVLAVLLGVAFVSGTLIFTSTSRTRTSEDDEKSFDRLDVPLRPGKNDPAAPGPAARSTSTCSTARQGPARRRLRHRRRQRVRRPRRQGRQAARRAASPPSAELLRGPRGPPVPDGRGPRAAGRGRDRASTPSTAERAGYQTGDTVRLSVNGPVLTDEDHRHLHHRRRQCRRGRQPRPLRHRHRPELFAKPGRYDQIDVQAAAGTPARAAESSRRTRSLPNDAEAATGPEARRRPGRADQRRDMSSMQAACWSSRASRSSSASSSSPTPSPCWSPSAPRNWRCCGRSARRRRQVTRSVLIEASVVGAGRRP